MDSILTEVGVRNGKGVVLGLQATVSTGKRRKVGTNIFAQRQVSTGGGGKGSLPSQTESEGGEV